MKIDVFMTPGEINDIDLRESNSVVIDVLRASSSLLHALYNGCKEIIPVETVERALSLQSALFNSNTLLCGERECAKIEGFDLGNSPAEFTQERIGGKSIIFTSTNFPSAVLRTKNSKKSYICGFQNIDTVAKELCKTGDNVAIFCAGRNAQFAIEDFVCAGMLIDRVIEHNSKKTELTDASSAAKFLNDHHKKDLKKMVKESNHGKKLMELGMADDFDSCLQIDSHPVLPVFSEGKIILG